MSKSLQLMLVAGEPSGDAHAASLVSALRESSPHTKIDCFGATGPLMRNQGVETIINSDDLAIMGIVEVGRVLPKFLAAFKTLKAAAIERKPDAVILIDWPEFNLRLARSLHRRGLKVIYYISPQLWAWRPGRIKIVKRDVDLLLSILPFEADWFQTRGVSHVEFVGHPLSGEVHARYDREEFCRRHELDPARPILALLPGSRHKELVRILPPMLQAADLIYRAQPDVQPVVVVAPSRDLGEVHQILQPYSNGIKFTVVHHQTREALAAADVAAVASGTATLEAALLGTPMVIVYKESAINWHTLGSLINVDHYGLVNLVAGERLVTELMQNDLTGDRLATELLTLLDPKENLAMRAELKTISEKLGDAGASKNAADAIRKFLRIV